MFDWKPTEPMPSIEDLMKEMDEYDAYHWQNKNSHLFLPVEETPNEKGLEEK